MYMYSVVALASKQIITEKFYRQQIGWKTEIL